jgi:ABC-2 type transport system permease protein
MVAVARDSARGVVDRFRSLPISRAALPFGQVAATAACGLVSFVLMGLCGLAVGWGIHRSAGDALGALALLVAFQFAATWVGIYLGLVIGNEQTAAQASILVFPVTMLSNIFVPTGGMPAGCARSPTGTRSARWPPRPGSCSATRPGPPTAPGRSSTPSSRLWPGRRSCSPSSSPLHRPLRPPRITAPRITAQDRAGAYRAAAYGEAS